MYLLPLHIPAPDLNHPDGYKSETMCGVHRPTKAMLINCGLSEEYLLDRCLKRQCDKYMKLALQEHIFERASRGEDFSELAHLLPNDTVTQTCGGPNGTRFAVSRLDGCPYSLTVRSILLSCCSCMSTNY